MQNNDIPRDITQRSDFQRWDRDTAQKKLWELYIKDKEQNHLDCAGKYFFHFSSVESHIEISFIKKEDTQKSFEQYKIFFIMIKIVEEGYKMLNKTYGNLNEIVTTVQSEMSGRPRQPKLSLFNQKNQNETKENKKDNTFSPFYNS